MISHSLCVSTDTDSVLSPKKPQRESTVYRAGRVLSNGHLTLNSTSPSPVFIGFIELGQK